MAKTLTIQDVLNTKNSHVGFLKSPFFIGLCELSYIYETYGKNQKVLFKDINTLKNLLIDKNSVSRDIIKIGDKIENNTITLKAVNLENRYFQEYDIFTGQLNPKNETARTEIYENCKADKWQIFKPVELVKAE